MHRIDTEDSVSGAFQDANPSTGQLGTVVDAAWLNNIQEEVCNTIESAGITLSKTVDTQLLSAIGLISGQQAQTTVRSDSQVTWSGTDIAFTSDIQLVYRQEAGSRRILNIQSADSPIALADGEVLVVRKDNTTASPVNLVAGTYATLAVGEYAVVLESSLTLDNASEETIVCRRRGTELEVVPNGDIYPTAQSFFFGNTAPVDTVVERWGTDNIDFDYDGGTGTFQLVGFDGTALSGSNPGFVVMGSAVNTGKSERMSVTQNYSWIDDTGVSEIIGELFGTDAATAWGTDRPFYLYLVNEDDTAGNLKVAISANPIAKTSPVASKIGYKGNPSTDLDQETFWFPEASDPSATHASKPCIKVGYFRMQKSASDDWTVLAFNDRDGAGKSSTGVYFSFPQDQYGATQYLIANAGSTPPEFQNLSYQYMLDDNTGKCHIVSRLEGDAGTDGTGAVGECRFAIPYYNRNQSSGGQQCYVEVLTTEYHGFLLNQQDQAYIRINRPDISGTNLQSDVTNLTYGLWTNGNRELQVETEFQAFRES